MAPRRLGVSYSTLKRTLLGWPGVEQGTSYGKPSLKAFGKFPDSAQRGWRQHRATGIRFDQREMLMETQGDVFHITPHYRNFPSVLMRLSASNPASVEAMLRRRWRELAPKKISAEFDAAIGAKPEARRKST